MLSKSEIERRLPVWHVLSDIFLDTELQPLDYQWIAAVLASSGYRRDELRSIFENEVAPAFIVNLFSVAGEWTSWSQDEVRQIMLRSIGRRFSPARWVGKRLARRLVAEEWQKITTLLAE
jgi:hypothetical protein